RKAVRMGVKVTKWKGKYYVFIRHRGNRKSKSFSTQKAADTFASIIEAKLKLGEFGLWRPESPAAPPTLQEFYDNTILPFWDATLHSQNIGSLRGGFPAPHSSEAWQDSNHGNLGRSHRGVHPLAAKKKVSWSRGSRRSRVTRSLEPNSPAGSCR